MKGGPTIAELQRQVRRLKEDKGFEVTLEEQRLAYLTSEVGEVAREVLKLSHDGNQDAGEIRSVTENLGMEM